ncbi:hypothetical protein [Rhodococcus tukisamuensis]|nr:hypothetical protein [Rhodococcus tukisamuensis]
MTGDMIHRRFGTLGAGVLLPLSFRAALARSVERAVPVRSGT